MADEKRSQVAVMTSLAAKAPTRSVIAHSHSRTAQRARRCSARQPSLWGVVERGYNLQAFPDLIRGDGGGHGLPCGRDPRAVEAT